MADSSGRLTVHLLTARLSVRVRPPEPPFLNTNRGFLGPPLGLIRSVVQQLVQQRVQQPRPNRSDLDSYSARRAGLHRPASAVYFRSILADRWHGAADHLAPLNNGICAAATGTPSPSDRRIFPSTTPAMSSAELNAVLVSSAFRLDDQAADALGRIAPPRSLAISRSGWRARPRPRSLPGPSP